MLTLEKWYSQKSTDLIPQHYSSIHMEKPLLLILIMATGKSRWKTQVDNIVDVNDNFPYGHNSGILHDLLLHSSQVLWRIKLPLVDSTLTLRRGALKSCSVHLCSSDHPVAACDCCALLCSKANIVSQYPHKNYIWQFLHQLNICFHTSSCN